MTSSTNSPRAALPRLPAHFIEIGTIAERDIVSTLASPVPFGLISPQVATRAFGTLWWQSLVGDLGVVHILDCDDDASLAASALRHGQQHIVYRGDLPYRPRLLALARVTGGVIHRQRPPAFTLEDGHATEYRSRQLHAYLASHTG